MDQEEIKQALKIVYDVMASAEFARAFAQMYKHLLHALIEEGFSREEAMLIISNMHPTLK